MKTVFKISLLCLAACLLLSAFYFLTSNQNTLKIQTSTGEVITYQVEQALTPESQRLGLMNRESMPPNRNDFFVSATPRRTYVDEEYFDSSGYGFL